MTPHYRYLHLADQVENSLQDIKPSLKAFFDQQSEACLKNRPLRPNIRCKISVRLFMGLKFGAICQKDTKNILKCILIKNMISFSSRHDAFEKEMVCKFVR